MNEVVRIIIVEDELHNLRLLEGMIKNIRPEWEIVQTFESVKESVNWLRNNPHPALFFMDIQLADGLCFSIFDEVDITSMVIFTTAYDNYAIQAFKVNSIDYLLKPFREKDLEAAIEKFEHYRSIEQSQSKQDYSDILEAIRYGKKKYRKRFLISRGEAWFKLEAEDVAYFYSENKITTAVTFHNQYHVVNFSLENIEEEVNPEMFFRANRQVIVNIEAIEKIENYFGGKLKVRLNPPFADDLIISRLKALAFRKWVGE